MDLLGIRQQFIRTSGRLDLVTTESDDYDVDNGSDFFINSGVRFLDRKYLTAKTRASIFEELAIGSWYFTFPNCSYVEEVWCNDTAGRWKLTKYPYQTIKENYSEPVSESESGPPQFYSPIWIRSNDVNTIDSPSDFESLGTFFNYVKLSDNGSFNGVIFTPKTDVAYNIEIVGKFTSAELVDNTDTNYWTVTSPEILIKAALYQLEVFNRNTEGAKDWLNAIETETLGLEFDLVMEESNEQRIIE
jgi:hypothetical protein